MEAGGWKLEEAASAIPKQTEDRKPKEEEMAQKLLFDVKGMTCDNCVHHVTEAAKGVKGVTAAKVDLGANLAEVEGDFDPKQVEAAIEEEGYEAKLRA